MFTGDGNQKKHWAKPSERLRLVSEAKEEKNKNKKTGNRKKEPEMRKTNNGENQMKQQEGDRMRR